MKSQILKKLLLEAIDEIKEIEVLKQRISDLVDIYTIPEIYTQKESTQTTYGEICSCNPKNGGSGICGCTIGNTIVSRPLKSNFYYTNTTTINTLKDENKTNS